MGTTVTTSRPFSRLRALLTSCFATAASWAGSCAAGPCACSEWLAAPCAPPLYPNSFSAMTPASGDDSAPKAPMMHLHSQRTAQLMHAAYSYRFHVLNLTLTDTRSCGQCLLDKRR